jgi:hypothetical protein
LQSKLSFYKEKSMRLDDTMIASEDRIERLELRKINAEDRAKEIEDELKDVR